MTWVKAPWGSASRKVLECGKLLLIPRWALSRMLFDFRLSCPVEDSYLAISAASDNG